MTLKRRLIPKLQMVRRHVGAVERTVLVITSAFGERLQIGDPISQARIYEAQAADELVFLDIEATQEGRLAPADLIRRVAEELFMPLTVGGGVRSVDDVGELVENGADKVAINSAATEDPRLLSAAADAFGAQCIVASIDYRGTGADARVHAGGGAVATDLHPVAWAVEAAKRGAGEILLTSIDRDGSRSGLDVDTLRAVVESVAVPVIASGGCGSASDFVDGFRAGADAVAAGTYFCLKDENPMQTRSQVSNSGFPIRLHT